METKLKRIAQISKEQPKIVFTSIYHLINKELLLECHKELDGNKAVGIDRITKDMYNANLDENIENLVTKLKNKSYKPYPALRVYIPKANGKMRPLGISIYEDKIVQLALKKILEAIYEPRFKDNMFGFRPNIGCHQAIKYARNNIVFKRISYIVDADIKGFFDHIDHNWLIKMLELNIQDKNILRLIKKYLKAGIIDNGNYIDTTEGSAQGNIVSPVLANIYVHYILVMWYKAVIEVKAKGDTFLVVYADDFITGFQYKNEAEAFYKALILRMKKFGLELESSKSRLLEFGRFAQENKKKRGLGKPETFDFLGFTFYCSKTRNEKFTVKLKTSRKKFLQKVKMMRIWLYENRCVKTKDLIKALNRKLIGHYHYYGVSYNGRMMYNFRQRTIEILFKVLNKRSHKKSYNWNGINEMFKVYKIETPKIYVNLFE